MVIELTLHCGVHGSRSLHSALRNSNFLVARTSASAWVDRLVLIGVLFWGNGHDGLGSRGGEPRFSAPRFIRHAGRNIPVGLGSENLLRTPLSTRLFLFLSLSSTLGCARQTQNCLNELRDRHMSWVWSVICPRRLSEPSAIFSQSSVWFFAKWTCVSIPYCLSQRTSWLLIGTPSYNTRRRDA